ncbi:MAG: 30S ribosomal protein S9 [Candidatus Woesearchaeota archaeon]
MKSVHVSGKRKSAVARATARTGSGKVTINKIPLELYTPDLSRERIYEPLRLAGKASSKVDLSVNVAGGGVSAQSDAARLAIAKALVAFTKNEELEQSFLDYDRQLLVADVRRKEVRKPNRHGKARSKTQKSYR